MDPLVSTKLRPSQTRPKLVARPRLMERLDPEAGRRLTLLSAPAGFGKTTLLNEWAGGRAGGDGAPVAWVSLDEGDNDPVRFLSYLVAALGRGAGGEGFGEGVLAALRSPEPPRVQAVLGSLLNELADLPGEVTIVLDDYHLIDSEGVHGSVSFLLERLPANARLVISGRVDPPLPLARLRARDQMAELHARDLRFTPGESATFLNDVMGLELSEEDVAALETRTEGWIAGLQLAALSMRDRGDAQGFVGSFSGSNRHVLDFLAGEVLGQQTAQVRDFLLRTSVLGRMRASLCEALTGHAGGQGMLERLDRENLFVVALDDERRWYRYHHLFAEFLRGRLGRENPRLVGELHLRASGWYEDHGLAIEAIEHALSAPGGPDPDHQRAARLIEEGVGAAWGRGESPTVLRWLEALPGEAKRLRPRLFLQQAQALALTGRAAEVEPLLEEAERASGEAAAEDDRRHLLGFASAVRSWRARLQGDAPLAVELARRALALLPDEEAANRNFAALCLGDALRTSGDLVGAEEAFAEAAELGRSVGHLYGTLTAMARQARVRAERGRLREAGQALRRARRFVTERGAGLLPANGAIHVGMGALLYERDELDAAERELRRGVELAGRAKEVSTLVLGYVTLSRIKRARGDEEGALETAREAERVARAADAELEVANAAAWGIRLLVSRGDLLKVPGFERERAVRDPADAARTADLATLARLLHARGRHDEALRLLEEPREAAENTKRTGNLIEILTLQALVLRAKGDRGLAADVMVEALVLAEPEGYVRTFVDEGPPMADLLSGVLETQSRGLPRRVLPAHYLRKLLAALERDASGAGLPPAAGLSEPLSGRELEVLQLIAAGESNRRIASDLFVAPSTVKAHVKNIYRKLGTHSRTQAVATARELELI